MRESLRSIGYFQGPISSGGFDGEEEQTKVRTKCGARRRKRNAPLQARNGEKRPWRKSRKSKEPQAGDRDCSFGSAQRRQAGAEEEIAKCRANGCKSTRRVGQHSTCRPTTA